jgi:hypothetical protein
MISLRTLTIAAALALQTFGANAAELKNHVEELDRVDVYGSRTPLWKLREAIIEAEDRFHARYNDLNTKDDFDIKCRVEASTGTRLTTRKCKPLYQEDAVQEGAKQAVELRQKFQSNGGHALLGSNSPPVPAALAIMARRPEFERNMREVVQEHPELSVLLQQRAEAAEALARATRQDRNERVETPENSDRPTALQK